MIYPRVQKDGLTGAPVNVAGFTLAGDGAPTVEKVFAGYGLVPSQGYEIRADVCVSPRTTVTDDPSRTTDEKYVLTVGTDGARIEAATRRGLFRGAHTLAKLLSRNALRVGEIEDYPLFKKRGYIEGFYGEPWKREKRLSVMKQMAACHMNAYFYAPKDDVYHREKWREPYPDAALRELRELFHTAAENELDFCWCIGPGLSYRYTSDADFEALLRKLTGIYAIGVRAFGLLLDDIPQDFRFPEDAAAYATLADAHGALVNHVYAALKALDGKISLTVCPTQYSGDENGAYISAFGRAVPQDVAIFWTGEEICSRVLTVREADELYRSTGHRPLFWDNYPVNDCEMFQEMHLGPLIGRDRTLYRHCEGLIANVMEYAECSRIPLMTVADYLWNPLRYDPDESLRHAHRELLGDDAALFGLFADHVCVSCLSKYGSAQMSDTLARVLFLSGEGEEEQSLAVLADYIADLRACLRLLRNTDVPLFEELQKWVGKFAKCCDLLDAAYAVRNEATPQAKRRLSDLLEAYNADAVLLTGFCLRDFAEKTLKTC